jgi:hypothetical protein
MTEDMFEDLVALLKANDPVGHWQPNASAAFTRLAAKHSELTEDKSSATGRAEVVEMSIGDLTVVHRPDPPARSRMRPAAQVLAAAAAVVLLAVAGLVVSHVVTGSSGSSSRLRTVTPATSSSPSPTSTPAVVPPAPKPGVRTHPASGVVAASSPAHVGSLAGPSPTVITTPAPLTVHLAVSRTSLYPGQSVTVTYSWSDGDGQLLNVTRVEATAVKITRPPPCGSATHRVHSSSGSGSYVYTYPAATVAGAWLGPGPNGPVARPTPFRVGVQIGTGGNCAALQSKTAATWITLLPAPQTPTPAVSPSATAPS